MGLHRFFLEIPSRYLPKQHTKTQSMPSSLSSLVWIISISSTEQPSSRQPGKPNKKNGLFSRDPCSGLSVYHKSSTKLGRSSTTTLNNQVFNNTFSNCIWAFFLVAWKENPKKISGKTHQKMQQTQTSLIKGPKFSTNKNITPKAKQAFSFLLNKMSHLKKRKSGAEFLGSHPPVVKHPTCFYRLFPTPKTSEVAMMKRLFFLGKSPEHQQTLTQQKKNCRLHPWKVLMSSSKQVF